MGGHKLKPTHISLSLNLIANSPYWAWGALVWGVQSRVRGEWPDKLFHKRRLLGATLQSGTFKGLFRYLEIKSFTSIHHSQDFLKTHFVNGMEFSLSHTFSSELWGVTRKKSAHIRLTESIGLKSVMQVGGVAFHSSHCCASTFGGRNTTRKKKEEIRHFSFFATYQGGPEVMLITRWSSQVKKGPRKWSKLKCHPKCSYFTTLHFELNVKQFKPNQFEWNHSNLAFIQS